MNIIQKTILMAVALTAVGAFANTPPSCPLAKVSLNTLSDDHGKASKRADIVLAKQTPAPSSSRHQQTTPSGASAVN